MGQSDARELREEPDSSIKGICSGSEQDGQNLSNFVNAQCATVSSAAPSKETTSPVKSPISTDSSQTQKSSRTSDRGSTTKGKGLGPYWNESCAQISSRLLLPVETDLPDSGLNSLSTWLVSTVEKSWFSTNLKVVQNPSLPQIFSPSFTSSPAEFTDLESTGRKSKKIRLFLNPEQRSLVRQWFGVSRYVFNKTVKILQNGEVKANWKAIKTGILNDLPGWCKAVPYQIKSIAIKDACTAVREAKRKYKKTSQIQRVRFRSRKNPIQSCYIPKSAVTAMGIYHTKLGKLTYSESLPNNICDRFLD